MTRLDYGSAVLAGLPSPLLNRLQSVLNAAAHLVCRARKYDHVTHLLRDLHWLRILERIQFRLAVLAFCCRNYKAPSYLADELHWTDEANGAREPEPQEPDRSRCREEERRQFTGWLTLRAIR